MVLLIVAVIIFIILLISRRRLGYFGLTIFAGNYISQIFSGDIVGVAITLIMSFLVLSKSSKQEKWLISIAYSFIVSICVVLILKQDISHAFMLDFLSRTVLNILLPFEKWIILGSVVCFVCDILSFRIKKV